MKGGLHKTKAKWFMLESQRHSYHLVYPSPCPILGSLRASATTLKGVLYMHQIQGGATLLSLDLIFLLHKMFVWWHDVLCESTLKGHHTKVVQLGLRYGFILFILSEVMFLFFLFLGGILLILLWHLWLQWRSDVFSPQKEFGF